MRKKRTKALASREGPCRCSASSAASGIGSAVLTEARLHGCDHGVAGVETMLMEGLRDGNRIARQDGGENPGLAHHQPTMMREIA
jgi:hypothetical protein